MQGQAGTAEPRQAAPCLGGGFAVCKLLGLLGRQQGRGRLGRLHGGTGVRGAGGLGRLRGAGGRGSGRLGRLGLTSGHGLPGKPSNEALLGTVVQLRPEGSKLGESVVRRLGHWAENAGEGKEGGGLAKGLRKSAEHMDPAQVT